MQEFIVERNNGTDTTTAVDQALMKTFKDASAIDLAIQAGIVNEGEIISTIEDDKPHLLPIDQLREMQEEIRELQEDLGHIDNALPSDVSSDNLIASINAVLGVVDSLDVPMSGGAGKYIKAISEADGKISATEETFDTTVTQNSTKGVSSGAVYTAIAAATSGSASSLADETTARQNADTALDGKISTNATSSNRCPSASEVTTEISTAISDITLEIKKALYPVGSIYMNGSSDTNPATLLGFGTWTRIQDYYLRASGINATGSTGGSNSKTLTEDNIPQHSHTVNIGSASNTFGQEAVTGTMNQHALHNHTFSLGQSYNYTDNPGGGQGAVSTAEGRTDSANIDHTHSLAGITYSLDFGTKTSSSYGKASPDAIEITPEYKAVAVWQRTE